MLQIHEQSINSFTYGLRPYIYIFLFYQDATEEWAPNIDYYSQVMEGRGKSNIRLPTAATSTNYVQMERWVEQVGESERQGEGIRLKWWSVNGHGDQANRRGIPCQSRSRNRSNRSLIEAKCQAQKTQHSRCQGEGPKEQSSSRSSTAHNVKCVSHVTAELEHLLYERKSKTGPCVSPGNGTRTEGARA